MNGLPNAEVFADAEALAAAAARRVADAIRATERERIALCLSGGSTPKRLYRLLADPSVAQALPWERLHWFWGDERMVPPDHPDSNFGMVRGALLDHVPVPQGNVHPIPTDRASPDHAASRYAHALKAFYGADTLDPGRPLFDVVLLGLGEDGHTASLFPGSPTLDETSRWAAGEPEARQEPFAPRVTLTLPALASSRLTLFLVAGRAKRVPLAAVAAGRDLPASRIRATGEIAWLVDRAAAGDDVP